MILKLLISASILNLYFGHVASTGCHELQLSQLKSLNERMNQMIETISSLLPKSLKKLTPPAPAPPTPAPSVDYLPANTGYDISYYATPPTYSPPPMQHVMYVPSYAALPADIRLPRHSNPISTPRQYFQPELPPQPEYPFSTISSIPPQSPRLSYHEQAPHYVIQTPMPPLTPASHPSGPYSLIQSPYPPEYTHPYPFGYPLPASTRPNIPANTPGLPLVPVPVQFPHGAYILPYPQVSELPQKYV